MKDLRTEVNAQVEILDRDAPSWRSLIAINYLDMLNGRYEREIECGCLLSQLDASLRESTIGYFKNAHETLPNIDPFSIAFNPPGITEYKDNLWSEEAKQVWVSIIADSL